MIIGVVLRNVHGMVLGNVLGTVASGSKSVHRSNCETKTLTSSDSLAKSVGSVPNALIKAAGDPKGMFCEAGAIRRFAKKRYTGIDTCHGRGAPTIVLFFLGLIA